MKSHPSPSTHFPTLSAAGAIFALGVLAACSDSNSAATTPALSTSGDASDSGADPATPDAGGSKAVTQKDWVFQKLVNGRGAIVDIWGSGPTDIHFLAQAYKGTSEFLHYNGSEVRALAAVQRDFVKVYGVSADDAWAVGSNGSYATYRGGKWTSPSMSSSAHPTNGNMTSTYGRGALRWAVGPNFGSDGIATTLSSRNPPNRDIWMTSESAVMPNQGIQDWNAVAGFGNDVWFSSDSKTLWWNGTQWASFGRLGAYAMHGGPDAVAYLNGIEVGLIERNPYPNQLNPGPYQASIVSEGIAGSGRLSNDVLRSLTAVWVDEREIWVVGRKGICFHSPREVSYWEAVPTGVTEDLLSFWKSGDTLWVGGKSGLFVARPSQ